MAELEINKAILTNSSDDGNYAEFILDPLERGYGVTLGNSLRRVLLSSIPGAAACSVKIDGVTHEFSSIPGIREDVSEIVLNVKEIIVRLNNCDSKTLSKLQENLLLDDDWVNYHNRKDIFLKLLLILHHYNIPLLNNNVS